jgi:hypothetical protein
VRVVALGHECVRRANCFAMTASGELRMARVESWLCRNTWNPMAGLIFTRLQASRIGRRWSVFFQVSLTASPGALDFSQC